MAVGWLAGTTRLNCWLMRRLAHTRSLAPPGSHCPAHTRRLVPPGSHRLLAPPGSHQAAGIARLMPSGSHRPAEPARTARLTPPSSYCPAQLLVDAIARPRPLRPSGPHSAAGSKHRPRGHVTPPGSPRPAQLL